MIYSVSQYHTVHNVHYRVYTLHCIQEIAKSFVETFFNLGNFTRLCIKSLSVFILAEQNHKISFKLEGIFYVIEDFPVIGAAERLQGHHTSSSNLYPTKKRWGLS